MKSKLFFTLFLPNLPVCCEEFEPLLSWRFWLIPQEWSATDASLVYPATITTECYDEQLSDKCLTLLLGTWYEPQTYNTGRLHDRSPSMEPTDHNAPWWLVDAC